VHLDRARDVPRAIFGLDEPTTGATDEARALGFIRTHSELLGGLLPEMLRFEKRADHRGRRTLFFQLRAGGYDVEKRFVSIRFDSENHVRRVHSDFDRWTITETLAPVPAAVARRAAMQHLDASFAGEPRRVVLPTGPGRGAHVWRVPVARIPLMLHYRVYVDAASGTVIRAEDDAFDQHPVAR